MKKKLIERGFTLSEVIITLVVLGIVAAITVPMLSTNANGKKWNVARQKAKATIGETFRLMTVNGEIDKNHSTEYIVTKIIPKYLKLEKTCGSGAAAAGACGFKMVSGKPKIKRPDNVEIDLPLTFTALTDAYAAISPLTGVSTNYGSTNTNNYTTTDKDGKGFNHNASYFFRTLDGFSVALFYNPYCATSRYDRPVRWLDTGWRGQLSFDVVCFNAIYDMNGKQGPNKVGMDIGFVGSVYNGYEVKSAAVSPDSKNANIKNLKTTGANYFIKAANYCKNRGLDNEWVIPDLNELSLVYMNKNLVFASIVTSAFISRTVGETKDTFYNVAFKSGLNSGLNGYRGSDFVTSYGGGDYYVLCVRSNPLK